VLGRQRDASARLGPATDEAPQLGGLRIGKADPEGSPDGDGQLSAACCCPLSAGCMPALACLNTGCYMMQTMIHC
jgi:hypothetical protein